MIERDEVFTMRELRIGVRVGAVLHLVSGNAVRLQTGLDGGAIEFSAPGCDRRIDRVAMLESSRRRRVARVVRKVFIVHCGAQAAPIVIVAAYYRDPIVIAGGRINAVGREGGGANSGARIGAAGHRVVENGGPKKVNRAFSLRLIDVLALPGAPPMIQRGENRDR